ncbi:MAG: hypothetical protein EP344_13790 [Bacteroidetes bacterium]|nr:MAG: hypothetical protein EP344_13790 [Bacteroidota bacterium]
MGFWDRLFGTSQPALPDIPFGRYTDAYKTDAQTQAWNRSIELFDLGKQLEAYQEFLTYLRDEQADNVHWKQDNDTLTFEFWQGSQRVTGVATQDKVTAESKVAQAEDLNVGFLRRLMEYNYSLKFCRFALDPDNNLIIRFDTAGTDGSPLKLLHALRELAIHADKQDDLLLDEFRSLRPVEKRLEAEIPVAEKEVKYRYLIEQIQAAFARLDRADPDPNQYPGGYAYLLLSLAFRLDYLLRPEGFLMDTLEKIYSIYFTKDDRSNQLKILALRKEFQKILDRPKEQIFHELYRTRSTFGINPPANHERIVSLIDGELPNMDWLLNQNHLELALAIPQYIVGNALFQHVPPRPDRDLLHLFYQITEPAFFRELGFPVYTDPNGLPNKRLVMQAIRQICENNRAECPRLRPDLSRLDFVSLPLFARSFLDMVRHLDLTKEQG